MIRSNLNIKPFFLIKIILIYLIFSLKSHADNIDLNSSLVVLGSNNAPVKIKIFSSLTCPHCANFHIKIVPEIKNKDIRNSLTQLLDIRKND